MNTMYVSDCKKMTKFRQKLLLFYIKRKKQKINCIVVGKKLKQNEEFMEKLNGLDIPIADGRWLFKFLVIQIIEYICKCQGVTSNEQRIVLVTGENNSLITYYIEELTRINKKIKIVTGHREKFQELERKLYYDKGIVLEISNNRRKAMLDTDIIFNFDMDEDRFNKYKFADKAIIVNLKEKIEVKSKRFEGINANFYDIDFYNRMMSMLDWTDEFEKPELYESYVYKNCRPEDIERQIISDNIKIISLIGNNGKIQGKEYKNT